MPAVAHEPSSSSDAADVISTAFAKTGALGSEERRLFTQFAKDPAASVDRLFVHLNAESHDPNDFARGFTAILGQDASVCIDYIHQNMFGQVMLFDMRPEDPAVPFEASYFDGKTSDALSNLNAVVEQAIRPDEADRKSPPSMACALFSADSEAHGKGPGSPLRDGRKWQAVLGQDGRVAVLKEDIGDEVYVFRLFVQVGMTQASQDLYRWVFNQVPGSLSYGDFIESREFKYVQSLNRRNAQRLAAKAAKALAVKVETIADGLAHTKNAHELQPSMAVPMVHNEYNVTRGGTWDHKKAFFVYDNSYSTTKSVGGLLLTQDPCSPVLLFPVSADGDDGQSHHGIELNDAAGSFPMSLGQGLSTEEAIRQEVPLTADKVRLVNKRITWTEKGGGSRWSDEWSNHRLVTGVYNKFNVTKNPVQRRVLAELYGRDLSAVRKLTPVIVKISADE